MTKSIYCFVNGIYSKQIGGGDIYFANLFKDCPMNVHVMGGYYTYKFLRDRNFPSIFYHTDTKHYDTSSRPKIFISHLRRLINCLPLSRNIPHESIAYTMSDYWFDSIPLWLCKSSRKILYLGMIAPKSSWYHWLSQRFSLWLCKGFTITYSHPDMEEYLRDLGHKDIHYIPNGLDYETCNSVLEQRRIYDIVWCGRIHPQKGIEDLVWVINELATRGLKLNICLIGKAGPEIKSMLNTPFNIYAPGIVSEHEKFRLLKSSKVFIFPSHNESFGIAPGEAILAGCKVVCYDLPCYKPVYDNEIIYAKCFDKKDFLRLTLYALSEGYIPEPPQNLAWTVIRKKFHALLS